MATRAAVEATLIVIALGAYVAYHLWLLWYRGRGHKVSPEFHDFFMAGKLARSIWAEACAHDEKEAILGVQQARNAMSACTYMATIAAVLATAGITVLLDSAKTDRMHELALNDPILKHFSGPPLASPVAILGLALGTLYGSFMCFAQSVRLYVHVGFYIRAVPSRYNPGTLNVFEAKKVTIKAGMAFTVGLRLFYLFIPLVLWSVGVTALLFSALGMTCLLMYMDYFDSHSSEELRKSLTVNMEDEELGLGAITGPRAAAEPAGPKRERRSPFAAAQDCDGNHLQQRASTKPGHRSGQADEDSESRRAEQDEFLTLAHNMSE